MCFMQVYACRTLYTRYNMETLNSHVLLTIYSAAMMPSTMAQKKQEITPRLMKMMEATNCKRKAKQTWMDQKLKNKERSCIQFNLQTVCTCQFNTCMLPNTSYYAS